MLDPFGSRGPGRMGKPFEPAGDATTERPGGLTLFLDFGKARYKNTADRLDDDIFE